MRRRRESRSRSRQDPADTFWDNTWGVAPFTFSSWGYRTFFTQWLQSFVSYNAQETALERCVLRRRHPGSSTRPPRRGPGEAQDACGRSQQLQWDDGGYIIPYFKQTIDGASKKVHGIEPHVFPALSWYRFWNFWLS